MGLPPLSRGRRRLGRTPPRLRHVCRRSRALRHDCTMPRLRHRGAFVERRHLESGILAVPHCCATGVSPVGTTGPMRPSGRGDSCCAPRRIAQMCTRTSSQRDAKTRLPPEESICSALGAGCTPAPPQCGIHAARTPASSRHVLHADRPLSSPRDVARARGFVHTAARAPCMWSPEVPNRMWEARSACTRALFSSAPRLPTESRRDPLSSPRVPTCVPVVIVAKVCASTMTRASGHVRRSLASVAGARFEVADCSILWC